jgi:dTDP-4-amino-4,6-dideoxygalactose transaminase
MSVDLPSATRREFLPFSPPSLGEEEIAEVADTLRSGWLSTGPKTRRFEVDFQAYLGAPGTLAVSSCTAALHTALATAGVGRGDEVITTTYTFAATANVVEHLGARPVLVDVEADTLNIDPAAVEAALTPRTRAIVPVHFAGHPADLDPLRDMARQRNLLLLEDAAHSLPASYKGQRIGAGDNPAAFSFYATKNLVTGEGGALTASQDFLDQARVVSRHGMSRDGWNRYDRGGSWSYEITMPGYKYNMSDIMASLGLWQLRKLDGFQERRREVVARYHEAFAGHDSLELPVERAEVEHAWHLYVIRIRPETLTIGRDEFIRELAARNIGTSVHFIPVHLHPYYRDTYGYQPEDYPVAFDGFERAISLPLHPGLSPADVDDVAGAVLAIAAAYRR